MSDAETLRDDARQEELADRIWRINQRRIADALAGPPGDPPALICEDCGFEECYCQNPDA